MKKILVPLALADELYAGPAVGAHFAEACEARLVLLHVVRPGFAEPASLVEEMARRAEAQLAATAVVFRSRVPVDIAVRVGCPVEMIAKEARAQEAQAIVMSTHGCRGWRKWLHRNTALKVLQAVTCPVWLVAPARSEESFTLALANWSLPRPPQHILPAFGLRFFFPKPKDVGGAKRIVFEVTPVAAGAHRRPDALSSVRPDRFQQLS